MEYSYSAEPRKKLSIIGKKKAAKSCQQSLVNKTKYAMLTQPHLVVSSFEYRHLFHGNHHHHHHHLGPQPLKTILGYFPKLKRIKP
jgi:hypothetical protein